MLTRPVVAVRFDLSSTPSRRPGDEDRRRTQDVLERGRNMQHAADRRQPIHQVETIFRNLLVIGNWLLQASWRWPVLETSARR